MFLKMKNPTPGRNGLTNERKKFIHFFFAEAGGGGGGGRGGCHNHIQTHANIYKLNIIHVLSKQKRVNTFTL